LSFDHKVTLSIVIILNEVSHRQPLGTPIFNPEKGPKCEENDPLNYQKVGYRFALRENVYSYHCEDFSMHRKWLRDHPIKFARWKHSAVARFTLPGATYSRYCFG